MSPEYRHAGTYYYSNMTSFTKMLPLKPSLAVTLKRITIDSVDHYNCGVDATDSLEKMVKVSNALEEITIRAVMTRAFINAILGGIVEGHSRRLKRVHLTHITYTSRALEAPDNVEAELRSRGTVAQEWAGAIERLEAFHYREELREEVTEELNPKSYNSRLFQEWRRQLDLETIDLTGDSDSSD